MQNLPPEPDNHKSLSVLLGLILGLTVMLLVAFVLFTTNKASTPTPVAPTVSCVVVGNVVKCNTTDLAVAAKYCPAGKIVANTYQLRNDNSRTTFICARKGDRDYND